MREVNASAMSAVKQQRADVICITSAKHFHKSKESRNMNREKATGTYGPEKIEARRAEIDAPGSTKNHAQDNTSGLTLESSKRILLRAGEHDATCCGVGPLFYYREHSKWQIKVEFRVHRRQLPWPLVKFVEIARGPTRPTTIKHASRIGLVMVQLGIEHIEDLIDHDFVLSVVTAQRPASADATWKPYSIVESFRVTTKTEKIIRSREAMMRELL
jgi:hypothetical protein